MKRLLILVVLLLCSRFCFALPSAPFPEVVWFNVAVGDAEDTICPAFRNRAIDQMQLFYLSGFNLHFKRRGALQHVPEQLTTPTNAAETFGVYAKLLNLRFWEPTILLAPPIRSGKKRMIGGLAQVGGIVWGGPAIVYTAGAIPQSGDVAIHEVGHLLGLGHSRRCTWMDSGMLKCKRVNWTVTDRQRRMVNETLSRR